MADNITLGPCHYDIDEVAVAVAVHSNGTGWIPVCDEHKKEAEKDGYEIRPDVDEADRATSKKAEDKANGKPAEEADAEADAEAETAAS